MSTETINISKLGKSFDGNSVLKGVSAAVHAGEVIGVLGLNGAGKTTLLETLLGFCVPDSGCVRLFGRNSVHALDTATKARIGFVPQCDELVESMHGQQYLDLIAGFYPTWNLALIKRLTDEWTVPLNLKINKLSVGQRQKLSILAALGHEPELLVLDEPVASLDPLARRQFLKELINISAARDRTILFSTHIVSDLERIASRVWLIKDGDIAIDTELDSIKEHYVRVHLPPGVSAPASLPGLLSRRQEQSSTILVFNHWSEATCTAVEKTCGPGFNVEVLALEEIFLELHA